MKVFSSYLTQAFVQNTGISCCNVELIPHCSTEADILLSIKMDKALHFSYIILVYAMFIFFNLCAKVQGNAIKIDICNAAIRTICFC